jgi:hypothetical protein
MVKKVEIRMKELLKWIVEVKNAAVVKKNKINKIMLNLI